MVLRVHNPLQLSGLRVQTFQFSLNVLVFARNGGGDFAVSLLSAGQYSLLLLPVTAVGFYLQDKAIRRQRVRHRFWGKSRWCWYSRIQPTLTHFTLHRYGIPVGLGIPQMTQARPWVSHWAAWARIFSTIPDSANPTSRGRLGIR